MKSNAAEFIYETAPFPSCHASTIVEASPGVLLAAWFGGTREGDQDVAIWLSRFDGAWSVPEKIAEERGQPCWNPVLFREQASGEIQLYYKAGPSPREWSGFVIRSTDGGNHFDEPAILPAGLLGPIKNKPIQLADGTIVAGTSVESHRAWACWMELSRDQGRTWTKAGPIHHREHPMGVIQPALLRRADSGLTALMRATRRIGQVCRSDSSDQGLTWSPAEPVSNLPNPNSGIDAVTLADGRHLLVFNPTHVGRTPLGLAVSENDGQSWKPVSTLVMDPGEYSYPAIIQASDGAVHVTYTWRRERIRHHRLELEEIS